MKKSKRIWILAVLATALLATYGCAETGPDAGGFDRGAGGGGVASGFGQVGNGGTSSGLEAGEGGEESGIPSGAGEGGPSSGVYQGGNGALICDDLCEYVVECVISPRSSGFEEDSSPPSSEEIALIFGICQSFCLCMVGKVPDLAPIYDKALSHAVCNGGLSVDENAESSLESMAEGLDEQLVGQALEECEHELYQGGKSFTTREAWD